MRKAENDGLNVTLKIWRSEKSQDFFLWVVWLPRNTDTNFQKQGGKNRSGKQQGDQYKNYQKKKRVEKEFMS